MLGPFSPSSYQIQMSPPKWYCLLALQESISPKLTGGTPKLRTYLQRAIASFALHPAMQETRVQFLSQERSPGEGNGNPLQYSCLENPWTEEPGGLQSMGLQTVGNDWVINILLNRYFFTIHHFSFLSPHLANSDYVIHWQIQVPLTCTWFMNAYFHPDSTWRSRKTIAKSYRASKHMPNSP